MLKEPSCTFLKNAAFIRFIGSFGIDIIDDTTANQILKKFQTTAPLTAWGHVDWETYTKKIVLDKESDKIPATLQELTGNSAVYTDTFYVELTDPDMPLFTATLTSAVERLEILRTLSPTIFIFDKVMKTVIEIDVTGQITMGFKATTR